MKNILRSILLLAAVCAVQLAASQDSIRELMRANPDYYCGDCTPYYYTAQRSTPAPRGFKPFFVNHVARHGSRSYLSGSSIVRLTEKLDAARSAGVLTERGQALERDLKTLYDIMDGSWGDLTPLGELQHRQIAARMYASFPEIFAARSCRVSAVSTTVPRSMVSMASFMTELKGCNPRIEMSMQSSNRFRQLLAVSGYSEHLEHIGKGAYREPYGRVESTKSADRFMQSLFSDGGAAIQTNGLQFMYNVFSIASIVPNLEQGPSLMDYFTDSELFDMWELHSLNDYLIKARSVPAEGIAVSIIKKMLEDMLVTSALAAEGRSDMDALFRFAHGENTIPLAAVMQLEGMGVTEADPTQVYTVWQNFKANPMATNIQWVLYRNRSGQVLVKVLFNEREQRLPAALSQDLAPYYRWEEFYDYYTAVKDSLLDLRY